MGILEPGTHQESEGDREQLEVKKGAKLLEWAQLGAVCLQALLCASCLILSPITLTPLLC